MSLVKRFGRIKALNDLNMAIPTGISALIGPNGAGKTTAIHVLLGLMKPDEGRALIFGMDSWRESEAIRARVGILHENPAYPRTLSGIAFLRYVCKLRKVSDPNREAKETLELLRLTESGKKLIGTYSAGMIKRLGLAQALVGETKLVILDEPTANLDPSGRIFLLDKITELAKSRGLSFLISSHVLSELEQVCSWATLIKDGRLIVQERLEVLIANRPEETFRVRTSSSEILAASLKNLGVAEIIEISSAGVLFRTSNPKLLYKELPKIIAGNNLELFEFSTIRSHLEGVYRDLIGN